MESFSSLESTHGSGGQSKAIIHFKQLQRAETPDVKGVGGKTALTSPPKPAEPKQNSGKLPRGFDEATTAAWKNAGAQVGWINTSGFRRLSFDKQPDLQSATVPPFRFSRWRENVLAGLPDPAVPFGLSLDSTSVTDAGLKELAGLKNLQTLDLGQTQVTDAGRKELAGFMSLQTLELNRTPVTDTGLKELAGLKNLESLYLAYTKVTDAGLKELAGLKNLQSLNLVRTRVTAAGIAELRKALPACSIVADRNR